MCLCCLTAPSKQAAIHYQQAGMAVKTFGEKGDEEQFLSLLNAILAKTKYKKQGVYRRPGKRRGLQPAV